MRRRQRRKRFSTRDAINQVANLAHREKLPETTAALGVFLNGWEDALDWVDFEGLVQRWGQVAAADLDQDRVGVFWALLFLSSQGSGARTIAMAARTTTAQTDPSSWHPNAITDQQPPGCDPNTSANSRCCLNLV